MHEKTTKAVTLIGIGVISLLFGQLMNYKKWVKYRADFSRQRAVAEDQRSDKFEDLTKGDTSWGEGLGSGTPAGGGDDFYHGRRCPAGFGTVTHLL